MKYSRNVDAGEVALAIMWFKYFLTERLERKVNGFEATGKDHPLLAEYYRNTFKLEYALVRLMREFVPGQPIPVHPTFSGPINFVVTFVRIYQGLSAVGKKKLTEALDGTFGQAYGMRPLEFEMTAAGHFFGKGCDVNFVDLENQGDFEFIVSKDDEELEIECKTISADAGRVIDQKGVCTVGEHVRSIVTGLHDLSSRILTIKIKNRLCDLSSDALSNLYAAIPKALHGEPFVAHTDFVLTLEVKPEFVLPSEITKETDVKKFVGQKVGGLGKHVLLHAQKVSRNIICAVFESATPDVVLDFIAQKAAKAGRQFSHQRPSLVAIQIADMPEDALKELHTSPGVGTHKIADNLFEGPPRRPHVNAVAFSVLPSPEFFTKPGPEISNMSALVSMIRNPAAKFPSPTVDSGNPFRD